MFNQQVDSQVAISELIQGHIDVIEFGDPIVTIDTASVPFHGSFRGTPLPFTGDLKLRKFQNLWYFDSLSDNRRAGSHEPSRIPVDAAVVKVLTEQQASPSNQDMITNGVLRAGFKKATVVSILRGAGTVTLRVRLSGGTWTEELGRFIVLSKKEGSRTYWFLARLDK